MTIQFVLTQLTENGGYRRLREVEQIKNFLGAIVDLETKKEKLQIPRELKEFLLTSRNLELIRDGVNAFIEEFATFDYYGEPIEFEDEDMYMALLKTWKLGFGKINELVTAQEQTAEKITWTAEMDAALETAKHYLEALRAGYDIHHDLYSDLEQEEDYIAQYIEDIVPTSKSQDKYGLF